MVSVHLRIISVTRAKCGARAKPRMPGNQILTWSRWRRLLCEHCAMWRWKSQSMLMVTQLREVRKLTVRRVERLEEALNLTQLEQKIRAEAAEEGPDWKKRFQDGDETRRRPLACIMGKASTWCPSWRRHWLAVIFRRCMVPTSAGAIRSATSANRDHLSFQAHQVVPGRRSNEVLLGWSASRSTSFSDISRSARVGVDLLLALTQFLLLGRADVVVWNLKDRRCVPVVEFLHQGEGDLLLHATNAMDN